VGGKSFSPKDYKEKLVCKFFKILGIDLVKLAFLDPHSFTQIDVIVFLAGRTDFLILFSKTVILMKVDHHSDRL